MMTQAEKTEAVIAYAPHYGSEGIDYASFLEDHARDLARKLDLVMGVAKPGEINVATASGVDFAVWKTKNDIDDAIRAALEGD